MTESTSKDFTRSDIELRKRLFAFSRIHENILSECRRFLDGSIQEISRKFFEYLSERDEFYEIKDKHPELEKYSGALNDYVFSLFSGSYDESYANARMELIKGNIRNGIPFKYYQAFLFLIRTILSDVISRKAGGSPSVFAISGALDRLLMLEISLAHDVYNNEFAIQSSSETSLPAESNTDAANMKPAQFAMAYFKLAAKNRELQDAVKKESGKNPFAMAYFKVASKHIPKPQPKPAIKDNRIMNPMVLAYYKVVNRARELQEMNRRDALTGLFNKAVFNNFLQRNISFSKRISFPLSIAFFDVDEFKKINDTLGHQKGDEILMTIGGVLTGTMRDVDRAFRFGGDEFCVVFPGTYAKNACIFFDRFREGLSAIFPDVSVSIGIAQTGPQIFHEADDIVKRADSLMYEAKKVKGFHMEYDCEGEIAGVDLPEIKTVLGDFDSDSID